MGTNYYVRPAACPNPCAHCRGGARIHLGKSSGGWTFTFRAYPAPEEDESRFDGVPVVSDFASWRRLLDLGTIVTEYGAEKSSDELLALIDRKRDGISTLYGSDFLDADGNRFVSGDFC